MLPANKSVYVERAFHAYTRRYLRRSFHNIHLLGEPPAADTENLPLLVCLNHSSWWDLLFGFYLGHELIPGDNYGVMDERQLRRYRFFTRLGVIGVDRTSLHGAKEFLTYTEGLLKGQSRALWLTPQGDMRSSYERPLRFQPGLGHLAERLGDFRLLFIALHYEFWNERLPEAFVSLSPVQRIQIDLDTFQRRAFVQEQERGLEVHLDTLLEKARQRDASAFVPLLRGKIGISPTYDALRGLTARLRRERFSAEHSDVVTPQWKQK